MEPGLYEQVINLAIAGELDSLPQNRQSTEKIDEAEASHILAKYAEDIVKRGLNDLGGEDRLQKQVDLINKIVNVIAQQTEDDEYIETAVHEDAMQLLAIAPDSGAANLLGITAADMPRPETSISDSSLFTGAENEPTLFSELEKEIASADHVDMLVSFIKWSGLRHLMNALRTFTSKGGRLRVITTSYMGATDIKAIEELSKLPNAEIKVSYDTKHTRLHAKSYIFHRETGFTTAYVGSSNMSHAAMSDGLEWNLKATQVDLPDTIKKIEATFESYWNSKEFDTYTEEKYQKLADSLKAERTKDWKKSQHFIFDLNPYPFQQEILDQLEAERRIRNSKKNLVVAATGTGKTLIAAFDYRSYVRRQKNGAYPRLLFIAHRKEILEQSLEAFRAVLKDQNFGGLFVGNEKPSSMDHVFMSVQSANSRAIDEELAPDFFDYIVIDEFHHSCAPTYQRILKHFTPDVLLGLTATPERMDGKSVLELFDNRIAAEIRLPEAIDRKLLCPFHYFGVSDTVDLNDLKWARGGYDKVELSNVYTLDRFKAEKRANHVINSIIKYVTDPTAVRGLGFCVSVEHARFMTEHFNNNGIPSICLSGESSDAEREAVRNKLEKREIQWVFVVDLYNEGVDLPFIDTILFLRPTESLTIFLQQLGRGLRLYEGKECLTVLDFIGQANKNYNFESKFNALLDKATGSLKREMKRGFSSAPKGCYIQLEEKAQRAILDNIKRSFDDKAGLRQRIAAFQDDSDLDLSLANFLDFYRIGPASIYSKNTSFARLCAEAKVAPDFDEPAEEVLSKAFKRFASVDSPQWIKFMQGILPTIGSIDPNKLSVLEQRMLQMFYVTVWGETAVWGAERTVSNLASLAASPNLIAELMELLEYNLNKVDLVSEHIVDFGFDDCPLELHRTYSKNQILVSMDIEKPNTVREGVRWLSDKKTDIFFVTLNKSDKDYSPTTMYDDYSINEHLFHWQSQSTTSESSATGQRYINHAAEGSKVLLFVREVKKDALGTAPYTFLGSVNYQRHEGSRPMNIVWELEEEIPAKYLRKTSMLGVG